MASGPHTLVTMSVFSPTRFEGSRVGIIALRGPVDNPPLSLYRRARLAAEIGYDTVCFLYDATAVGQPRRLEIFVRSGKDGSGSDGKAIGGWGRIRGWTEVPFDAGGMLAATHYIFNWIDRRSHFSLQTDKDRTRQTTVFHIPKSGLNVPSFYNPYRQVAACPVPDIAKQFTVEEGKVSWSAVLNTQPQLKIVPGVEMIEESRTLPIVGLGGREWVLVDVTEVEDIMKNVEPKSVEVEGKWKGILWFAHKKTEGGKQDEPVIDSVSCRITNDGWEEEGSGNGATAVAAYLSLKDSDDLADRVEELKLEKSTQEEKTERRVFGVQTGVDVGRPGTIAVEIEVKTSREGKKRLESIIVSGRANTTTRGELVGT